MTPVIMRNQQHRRQMQREGQMDTENLAAFRKTLHTLRCYAMDLIMFRKWSRVQWMKLKNENTGMMRTSICWVNSAVVNMSFKPHQMKRDR